MKTHKVSCWWRKRTAREQFIIGFTLGACYLWLLIRTFLAISGRWFIVALLCVSLAAFPVMADQPSPSPQPNITFIEGLCIGLILGVSADIVIICAINCHKASQSTNAPPTVVKPLPPTPSTNSPPASTNAVLQAGAAVDWWGTQFQTTLEYCDGSNPWKPLYRIDGWLQGDSAIVLVSGAAGVPLQTNTITETIPFFVTLPFCPQSQTAFFRFAK